MKKIILFLLAILYVGICKAQLSIADCKYVLEIFCRNYYGSCFDGKTHTNVQFNAVIVRQPKRDYVIFNKWYEPDILNRKGGWETGQKLITYK